MNDDLISRSALLAALVEGGILPAMVRRTIERAPAVDAVPVVHGRWERVIPSKSAAKWSITMSCSVCHRKGYEQYNYCPNCGAKMDGGNDDG